MQKWRYKFCHPQPLISDHHKGPLFPKMTAFPKSKPMWDSPPEQLCTSLFQLKKNNTKGIRITLFPTYPAFISNIKPYYNLLWWAGNLLSAPYSFLAKAFLVKRGDKRRCYQMSWRGTAWASDSLSWKVIFSILSVISQVLFVFPVDSAVIQHRCNISPWSSSLQHWHTGHLSSCAH